jgi:hypothetical protein
MLKSDRGLLIRRVSRTLLEGKSEYIPIHIRDRHAQHQILRWSMLSIIAFERVITGRKLIDGVLNRVEEATERVNERIGEFL